jgi:hypothetical protein
MNHVQHAGGKMNRMILAALLVVLGGGVSIAHAELLVSKGSKATLHVRYQFRSEGRFAPPSGEQITDWNVRREVDLTARYAADAPQPFGVMHASDPGQQAKVGELKTRVADTATRMQPSMADMMKIVSKCGETDEACIQREVIGYGNSNQVRPELKSAGTDLAAINKAVGSARFQMWQLTSQSGTYRIDESRNRQIFGLTCTASKVCKRSDTRSGGGDIAPPVGGKSAAGSSTLEIDGSGKDMVLVLPVPLSPLWYTKNVVTSMPNDTGGVSKEGDNGWMLSATKPMTVTIPGDLKSLSGSKSFKIGGAQADGGTLTVEWTFTRL